MKMYVKNLLPQIYRSITERFKKDRVKLDFYKHLKFFKRDFMILISAYLVLNLLVFSFLLVYFWRVYNGVVGEREYVVKELGYWQGVASKHSNFADAYYKVAYFAVKVGNKELALENVEKALILDPGFKQAERLREIISQ